MLNLTRFSVEHIGSTFSRIVSIFSSYDDRIIGDNRLLALSRCPASNVLTLFPVAASNCITKPNWITKSDSLSMAG